MKLLLWNVNGLRAISKKEIDASGSTFSRLIKQYDIVVLNETKICEDQLAANSDLLDPIFYAYHAHAKRKGYSGVSILTKVQPIRRITPTVDNDEGRVVILEFKQFIIVGVYAPNSGPIDKQTHGPRRLQYRVNTWERQFRTMCAKLERTKPVIVMGDLNVAATELDVYAPTKVVRHAGFTAEERLAFGHLLETTSLMDTWRIKHPSKVQYTYFDYRTRARDRNAGWRIDYALVSKSLLADVSACTILSTIHGSDHLPLSLILKK